MKTIVKTAWERLLVSFMLVAATVLEWKEVTGPCPSPSQFWLPSLSFCQAASPSLISTVHEVCNVCVGGHSQFRKILHIGAQDGVLPDTKRAPTLGVQEVSYSLTIDLHVAYLSRISK